MKKKLSVFFGMMIAFTLLICTFVYSSTAVLMGDVNRDGRVSSVDARLILRVAARLEPAFDADTAKIADINTDGRVGAGDARLVLRMAARLDPTVLMTEIPADRGTTAPVEDEPTTPIEPESTTEKPSVPPIEEDTTAGPIGEPTTEEPAEPVTVVTARQKNYYAKTVVREYQEDGSVKTSSSEVAVQASQTKISDGAVVESHHCYFRSSDLFNGKDVGLLIRERVDGEGRVLRNYYLMDYAENSYLGLDSSIVLEFLPDMAFPSPDSFDFVVYPSLDGLNTQTRSENGVEYAVFTVAEADGAYREVYLLQPVGEKFYISALTKEYSAEKVLLRETQLASFSTDPSAYTVISGMNGVVITTMNFPENIGRFYQFMKKLGIDVSA